MLNLKTLILSGALIVAGGQFAHATTLGADLDPLGDRLNAGVKWATWDSFTQTQVGATTNYTFNGVSDVSSTLTGLSMAQSTAHALGSQGSGLLNSGDVYYASTFAQNWTLTLTASVNIKSISFQIKTANVSSFPPNTLFTPTITGIGTAYLYGFTDPIGESIAGFPPRVIEYRWADLNIAAGTPITITFANAGGPGGDFTRKPIDLVSVDVSSSVPEPGSAALCGLAALIPALSRRRRA